jgi:hypothetical protein
MKESSDWRMIGAPGGWVRVSRPADKTVIYMQLRGTSTGPGARFNVHRIVVDSSAPISTHLLRYVPFQEIEDAVTGFLNDPGWEDMWGLRKPADDPIDIGKLEERFGARENLRRMDEAPELDGPERVLAGGMMVWVLGQDQDPGERPPQLTRPERITDDFLADLARTYRWLVASGDTAPAASIAKEIGAPLGTVRRWVMNARQRGVLPPGRPGRAG